PGPRPRLNGRRTRRPRLHGNDLGGARQLRHPGQQRCGTAVTVNNSTLAFNSSGAQGGGLNLASSATAHVFNTTIAFNNFGLGLSGGGTHVDVHNTLVTGNDHDCTRLSGAPAPTSNKSFDLDHSCSLDLPSADPLLNDFDLHGG